jgi:hypothetical protein
MIDAQTPTSANQLTNPAVDPACKIPEYKACAAAVERLDTGHPPGTGSPRQNYTAASDPKMFPYAVGETKAPVTSEGKTY